MCPHDSRSMSMTVYCSSSFFVSSSHGPDTGFIQTRNWKWDIISLDPHSYILHTPAHERVQNVNRKTVIIMAKHWFNMTNDNRWNMEISIYMLHKMHSTNMTRRTIRCIDNFPILCLFFLFFPFFVISVSSHVWYTHSVHWNTAGWTIYVCLLLVRCCCDVNTTVFCGQHKRKMRHPPSLVMNTFCLEMINNNNKNEREREKRATTCMCLLFV